MKYILALFVLLAAYIPANIAGDYEETDYGYHEPTDKGESHGDWRGNQFIAGDYEETDYGYHEPTDKGESHGDSRYNQFCRQYENASYPSYKSKSKEIQRSWENDSKDLKKNAETFARKAVQKIVKTSEDHRINIAYLAKMSYEELQNLTNKTGTVSNEVLEALNQTRELLSVTNFLLQTALQEAATQISSKMYGDKIHELLKSSQFEILCIAVFGSGKSELEKEEYQELAKEANRELLKVVLFGGKTLRDTFSVQAKHIKTIASRAGEIIVSAARNHIKKINSTETTEKRLLKYINYTVKRIDAMTHHFKAKCNQITLVNLGALDSLINKTVKSMETFIKESEVKVNNAFAFMVEDYTDYTDAIEKMQELGNEVDKIYKTLELTITENNGNYIKSVSVVTADTIEEFKEWMSMAINGKPFKVANPFDL